MKKVGVVIPIYNTDKYLKQCIESVINQTYKNIEIALVDDGSTDDSGKICDEYAKKDNRIKVIHQKNSGKILARYNGAKILDCDYLTFVDSDDFIALKTYEMFVEQMEQNIDVIAWQIIRYTENYNKKQPSIIAQYFPSGYYNYKQFRKEIYPYMIWNFETNHFGINPAFWNKLIKRELLINALNQAKEINVNYGEDVAVIYPLFQSINSFYLSTENLYYCRKHVQGTIASYFKDIHFFDKLNIVYNYLLKYFNNEHFIPQLDAYYEYAVYNRVKSLSNRSLKRQFFLFPFEKILPQKNIILYGAGIVGKDYFKMLHSLNYTNKILWVDKNYKTKKSPYIKSTELLKNATDYDYVVIAIEDKKIATGVQKYLLDLKISEKKIIHCIYKLDI